MINCKHKIIEGNTTKYLFCRAKNKTINDYECKACPLTLPDLPQGFENTFWRIKKMKTKKLNYTKQGYSYLKCTEQDCYDWGGAAICDNCGEHMTGDVYLIYVLARAYCPKCFEDWLKRSKRYEEDIFLQKQNHERWYKAYGFNTIQRK